MATEVPPLLQKWIDKLDEVSRQGGLQYKARCPSHDDNHASLSISWGDKGKVVATCHANCSYSEIVKALGLTRKDLDPPRTIVARYDYEDEDGNLQYQVTRWEPKDFRQRQPDPAHKGKWINDMEGVELLPYHLPALAEHVEHGTEEDTIWIVEGEKDVEALENAYSAVATTNAGGASKWKDAYSEYLIGFKGNIVIVIDNDDKPTKPGQKHALDVYESVLRVAGIEGELVYPVEGKDAAEVVGKYDAIEGFTPIAPDALRAEIADGSTKAPETDEVQEAIAALFMAEEDARTTLIEDVHSDGDILAMAPPRYAIEGWLPVGFFSDFFGEPGSKKTFVINDQLRSIRAGIPWHGHAVTRGATLLFEGEGLEQLQARIVAWDEYHENPDMAPGGHVSIPIDMTTPSGVARVVRTVQDFEKAHGGERVVVVAFDPVVEYMNGEENGEGMEMVTRGFRALARYLDIAVVLGAHTNAAGERARGGDQLRMRAGAHVRVETLKGDIVGLVQEKQKNGERRALQLLPLPFGPSLVLEKLESMTATEYYAAKSNADYQDKAASKLQFSKTSSVVKHSVADELLIDHVRANPGVGKGKLVRACEGQGVGKPSLESRVDALVKEGVLRFDKEGTATNSPTHYFLVDSTETEEVE